jgi:biotin-(acetyl-CoA carboxylase) ligase
MWSRHGRAELSFPAVLREYDSHHALVGRQVSVSDNGSVVSGKCEGLDDMGRLLLRSRGNPPKLERVISGQVKVL